MLDRLKPLLHKAWLPPLVLALSGLVSLRCAMQLIAPARLEAWINQPLRDLYHLLSYNKTAAFEMLGYFALMFAAMLAGWWAVRRWQSWLAWGLVLGFGLSLAALFLFQYPYGAADIFDNIVHGRILGIYGANPFQQTAVDFPNDPFAVYSYWRNAISAYGPLWELLAGLTARLSTENYASHAQWIASSVLLFKLLPGFFWYAAAGVAAWILQRKAPERALGAVLLMLWNPLALWEVFGNGHNDPAMIFWMLAAAAFLLPTSEPPPSGKLPWQSILRLTLGVLSLVLGGLVKYIPVLLLPAAGFIALRRLPDLRSRAVFTAAAAVASAALVVVFYAPFWVGWDTLSIGRRSELFTGSLPTVIYILMGSKIGTAAAALWVNRTAALLTIAAATWLGWRAGQEERDWTAFPRAALLILWFYMLVACPWFNVWYALWTLALAVLLPAGHMLNLALLLSFSVLLKPFLVRPLYLWTGKVSYFFRESRLWLGMQGLAYLYILGAVGWEKWKGKKGDASIGDA